MGISLNRFITVSIHFIIHRVASASERYLVWMCAGMPQDGRFHEVLALGHNKAAESKFY
jgi:hypothetical protein